MTDSTHTDPYAPPTAAELLAEADRLPSLLVAADERAIWEMYLDETEPVRVEYDRRVQAANQALAEARRTADSLRATARHQAWEAASDEITAAWKEYRNGTAGPRQARDAALSINQASEVRP